jgi:hypothetical protein
VLRSVLVDRLVVPVFWIGQNVRPVLGELFILALIARVAKKNPTGVVLLVWVFP